MNNMKVRMSVIKKQIQTYAQRAVQDQIKSQYKQMVEDVLLPHANAFLNQYLDQYLKENIEASLNHVLHEFETMFSASDGEIGILDPSPVPKPEASLTDPSLVLLAYLQWYQVQTNSLRIPRSSVTRRALSLSSVQYSLAMQKLEQEGRVRDTGRKNGQATLEILRGVADPLYLLDDVDLSFE